MIVPTSYHFEDIEPGMRASLEKTITEADIRAFAGVTGDSNPVHLDAEYAAATPFKRQVAHGMLTAGMLSAVFGMKLPGPGAIYVSQTLNFRAPVYLGDTVTAEVQAVEIYPARHRVRFDCVCRVADRIVLTGEAMLIVPVRPS
jgi:3-hydroxybutyryl-CoA dehydratase